MAKKSPKRSPLGLTGRLGEKEHDGISNLRLCAEAIHTRICHIRDDNQRLALLHIISTIDSTHNAIAYLCDMGEECDVMPQPVCALLRSMIEALISTLAYCSNPAEGAIRYRYFLAILQWRWAGLDLKHSTWLERMGLHDSIAQSRTSQAEVLDVMRMHGGLFLKKKVTVDEAIAKSDYDAFDDKWFKQSRRRLLETYHLGWIYDMWYSRFSSSVHADAAALTSFAGTECHQLWNMASRLYQIALWYIADTCKFTLPSSWKGELNKTLKECTQP